MGFKLVICPPGGHEDWPEKIRAAVPDCKVVFCRSVAEAMEPIRDADAAFGNVMPELLARATKLRWIQAPAAGLGPAYFHEALVNSDVVVTNLRGIYNDHVAHHAMALVLAFTRGLPYFWAKQQQREWAPAPALIFPGELTVGVIGVGGIGGEVARLCKSFGFGVLGIDPRREDRPEGCDELWRPDRLEEMLPQADLVVMTCPETPETLRMMNARRFGLMKRGAFFINVGRAGNVVHDDLVAALKNGHLGGAALDVTAPEPLPPDHELWGLPNVIITPHIAAVGPHLPERRTEVFLDNCRRFNEGRPLRNVVDKANWF